MKRTSSASRWTSSYPDWSPNTLSLKKNSSYATYTINIRVRLFLLVKLITLLPKVIFSYPQKKILQENITLCAEFGRLEQDQDMAVYFKDLCLSARKIFSRKIKTSCYLKLQLVLIFPFFSISNSDRTQLNFQCLQYPIPALTIECMNIVFTLKLWKCLQFL